MPHLEQPHTRYQTKPPREGDIVQCEICRKDIEFQDALSMAAVYRMPGPSREDATAKLPSYQCPQWQHFGCCHEHALLALLHCLFEHIHFGEHSTSGSIIEHKKLQAIREILEEKYEELVAGMSGDV